MKPVRNKLLYVEDDIDDKEFFCEAMKESRPELEIITVESGQAAWDYVSQSKETGLPALVVLDINLPIFDGKELMKKIKADPALAHLPVVVLTSSESPVDKQWAEATGLKLYNKPYDISLMPLVVENLLKDL